MTTNQSNGSEKKSSRLALVLLLLACAVLLAFAYLAVIGVSEGIEAKSTGNLVVFSDQPSANAAAGVTTSFQPFKKFTVNLEGLYAGKGGLRPNELNLKIELIGTRRAGLFDPSQRDFVLCSSAEMRDLIRKHLVKVTGDQGLKVKMLRLSHVN